jgi:D-glycero-alpha-D-manno-heptose-7-phosphate kinase
MNSLLWPNAFPLGSPPSDRRGPVIRARAPLRLGLAGGGTDLSSYCDVHGGAVLNTTIDRYAYAIIEPSPDGLIHFVAPDIGIEERFPPSLEHIKTAKLGLHAGVAAGFAQRFNKSVVPSLRITSFVDASPGSGLGSSSALVVALVEAFRVLMSVPLGLYEASRLAFEIERIDLQLAGGQQDQYSAVFGGINFIEFLPDKRVIVSPLRVNDAIYHELETSMVVCFTGVSRASADIITEQVRHIGEPSSAAMQNMHQIKQDATEMKDALLRGEVSRMATILNRSWEAKKQTAAGISTGLIERLFGEAMSAGAIGGKISGAGGGGFLMFIVPPERRVNVIHRLTEEGAQASGIHFTRRGVESWII